MDVAEALDKLRAEVTGCELAAFTDLSSKMVLCVSSVGRRAQEELADGPQPPSHVGRQGAESD